MGVSPTDGLALMWHIPAKLSSAQSRRAVTMNSNIHDCVKLRRDFSQLSFMYVRFPFNIFLITHFRVVLSFEPPLDHNRYVIIAVGKEAVGYWIHSLILSCRALICIYCSKTFSKLFTMSFFKSKSTFPCK